MLINWCLHQIRFFQKRFSLIIGIFHDITKLALERFVAFIMGFLTFRPIISVVFSTCKYISAVHKNCNNKLYIMKNFWDIYENKGNLIKEIDIDLGARSLALKHITKKQQKLRAFCRQIAWLQSKFRGKFVLPLLQQTVLTAR